MVGGAVTIEDPQSKVLAYSSSDQPIDEARRQVILGRQVPEVWIRRLREDGIFQRLWGSEDVVRYDPGEGFLSRLAVAIRAGGEILGSIWAIEGDERLSPEAEAAMKEAAGIAALHLVRHRTTEDLERRRRGELLRAILEGQVPADAAASLGVDPDTGATVVALRWEPEPETETGRAAGSGSAGSGSSAGSAESVALTERASGLVAVYCESFHRQAALATIGGTIYVLIPEVRQRERDRLLKLVADLIDRAGATLHVRIRAGIGSTVPSLDEAVRSRREADQVIRVLAAGPAERSMAPIEDVRPATILLALRDHAARDPSLHSGPVELLVRHDAQKGTSYVDTLRAYLAAFGYIPAAAEMVNVHSNTFRYRLRRLIELSDLDLEDPAARLVAELQLYFLSGLPASVRPRPDLAPEDDGKGSGRRRPSPRRRPFAGETATG
jgi:DNA-binding PucR family transcriptional regulator